MWIMVKYVPTIACVLREGVHQLAIFAISLSKRNLSFVLKFKQDVQRVSSRKKALFVDQSQLSIIQELNRHITGANQVQKPGSVY